jgi:hypothetical protein
MMTILCVVGVVFAICAYPQPDRMGYVRTRNLDMALSDLARK